MVFRKKKKINAKKKGKTNKKYCHLAIFGEMMLNKNLDLLQKCGSDFLILHLPAYKLH